MGFLFGTEGRTKEAYSRPGVASGEEMGGREVDMGFIAGDSVLDAAYGYGMVCDVIRNPDETYPVICRFWQNGRHVEISYTRDGFNDVSDMIPSLVHAGAGAAKGKPVRLSFEDFDEEYRELFGGAGQKKP